MDVPPGPFLRHLTYLNLAANDLRDVPEGVLAAHGLRLLSMARNSALTLTPHAGRALLALLPELHALCLTEANGVRLGTPLPGALPSAVAALEELQRSRPVVVWGEAPPLA